MTTTPYGAAILGRVLAGANLNSIPGDAYVIGQYVGGEQIDYSEAMLAIKNCIDRLREECPDADPIEPLRSLNSGVLHPRRPRDDRPFRERNLTDSGNAERFADRHGADVRYVFAWGKWLTWRETHWAIDDIGDVQARVKDMLRAATEDARAQLQVKTKKLNEAVEESLAGDDTKRKKTSTSPEESLLKFLMKSESAGGRGAVENLARSEPGIPIQVEQLDTDPYLFNVANGTIDLRTGELRPHSRQDLITKRSPVIFDATATCPIFNSFLNRVLPDPDTRSFLQRAVGYAMTGVIAEHGFTFLYGLGANGKSTFVNTIFSLMGDYGRPIATEMLMVSPSQRHPTEMAALLGCRFAATHEAPSGKNFDESRLKMLTGGDRLEARRMREDFWYFNPTHHLFLCGNHRPRIKGQDEGIWRRVWMVNFDVQIPAAERNPHLHSSFHLPGILNWAIAGCIEWQRTGLLPPDKVRAAGEQYRQSQDSLAEFLEERCFISASLSSDWSPFVAAYREFCTKSGDTPMSKASLEENLAGRGWNKVRSNGKTKVTGVAIRP